MATANTTQEPGPTRTPAKPQRVLACVLCQQRKVKCDRKFPCAYCVRAGVQCVPGNAVALRQRRRRFPERELLERLRHYESLLRQNNISFGLLHPSEGGDTLPREPGRSPADGTSPASPREKTAVKSKEAVDLWHAISRATLDPEDDDDDESDDQDDDATDTVLSGHGAAARKVWNHRFRGGEGFQIHDQLLFGPPLPNVDLSTLHPNQVQMFRLWQIYLDKVDPLLKVTHTPTLQSRIVDAAGDLERIEPALEALLFSIYCIAIASLTEDECRTLFRSSKKDLLISYHATCQQALLKCAAWHSDEIDSLTAILLYLISVKFLTHPKSLSCMFAVAIRIAQRMGMHHEATHAGHTPLEAEMRRRLWWALVVFDHRVCELSDYKTTALGPTWDCHIPHNVNDFELRPEMKASPATHDKPTEALFTIVRSEVADFIRHSTFHLNFVNPSLNAKSQSEGVSYTGTSDGDELSALERLVEGRYLSSCDAENPLHYMTVWTTRGAFARQRLMEHYSTHSASSPRPTDMQRDVAFRYALGMLECDTALRISPLTKGFVWYADFHFPALAYLHILNVLGKRPSEPRAAQGWSAMNGNYEALAPPTQGESSQPDGMYRFFISFSQLVLQAWEARETFIRQQNQPPEPAPGFVVYVKNATARSGPDFSWESGGGDDDVGFNGLHNALLPDAPTLLGGAYGIGGAQELADLGPASYFPCVPGPAAADIDMDQFWSEISWI